MSTQFGGFPRKCPKFLKDLSQNNSKTWFEQNREDYENFVMQPSRDFVAAMGERLRKISPRVVADPRVNKSLFKIHRDTRFSQDKTPFKTHVGILFWEGHLKRMECSCFYFHLEPPDLMIGLGIYMFPKQHLAAYRKSVIDPKHGPALARAIAKVTQDKELSLGGRHYKKTPRGFDPEHKYADLLLHNGITVGVKDRIPKELHSGEIINYCFERYKQMAPIHKWLVEMTERI